MPRCSTCFRRLTPGRICPFDGGLVDSARSSTDPAPQTPPSIAGHGIGELLGQGGFARVWSAVREADGVEVALKVARDRDQLAELRLEREAEAMKSVGPEYTPRVYGSGRTEDGLLYISMERLRGRTLVHVLESQESLPEPSWVWHVTSALGDALQAVHDRGVIHRDLKPENVFLISESPLELKLFDFGLTLQVAANDDPRLTRPGTILGTSEYMAPEQLGDARELDHRLDIYAFGVLMYELFTLRPPFVGDRASIEHGHRALRPPSPREFAPVPESLEEVILECLAKDPARRPADMESLRRMLDDAWERAATSDASIRENKLSLLVEKRQPVVLAAIATDAARGDIGALVKRHGGFVAKETGGRYVAVFSGLLVDDPYDAAQGAAQRACTDLDARVSLHLARLAIRRKRRGPVAVGRAVDRVSEWTPSTPWDGIVLTRSLAETRPVESVRPAPGCDGFFALVAHTDHIDSHIEYVGQEPLLAAARASLRACLDSETPGLFTALGDAGLGKSRLAHELARLARTVCPQARIVEARALRLGASGSADAETARVVDEFRALKVTPDTHGLDARARPQRVDVPRVIILDDAQWCTSEVLDRIEYATLDHPGVPLWVAVIAHPNLENMRAQWGARAHRHERVELQPLPRSAAMSLAAELLLPADYPPTAILERLAEWAGGSPQILTSLIAELKRRGMVHKSERGEGWQVATAELSQLPAAPAEQWLYARMLDQMSPELAACVRVCAVLGPTFTVEELSAVQENMEEHGGAGTPIDAGVGLSELAGAELFERTGEERYAFARPAFQDAVYKLLARKDRRQIHEYAASYWRPRVSPDDADLYPLECFARHAAACGLDGEAAWAYSILGDRARQAHLYVQAENHYSAALRGPIEDRELEARLLFGRGSVRHHVHRVDESFEDLGKARAIFEELGERVGVLRLILEEATAADIAADLTRAGQCAQEAWDMAQTVDDPVLLTRARMALGRNHWRHSRIQEAIEDLSAAAEQARELEDVETVILSRLLLAPALTWVGETEAAARTFEELIEECVRINDRFHECAAYANRMFLWRSRPEHAIDDLRRAIEIAREIGNPNPEYVATSNLAHFLFWLGQEEEALTLARRSRALQQRFLQGRPVDALLLARIHVARDDLETARELHAWLLEECKPDRSVSSVDIKLDLLALLLGSGGDGDDGDDEPQDAAARWDVLMARAESELIKEEAIEVLWWRARAAMDAGSPEIAKDALARARALLPEAPIWKNRFENLSAEIC